MLEGINNFIMYHKAIAEWVKVITFHPQETPSDTLQSLNDTINSLKLSEGKGAESLQKIYAAVDDLSALLNSNVSDEDQVMGLSDLLTLVLEAVFKKFGFSPPKSAKVGPDQNPADPILAVAALGYEYFFASAGVVVFLLAVFLWFVRRKKDVYDQVAIAIRLVAALVLFGCIFFVYNDDLLFNYMEGPMILPTVLLILLLSRLRFSTFPWNRY